MVYQWKGNPRFPVKAQVAGETLASIRQANGGHLTPEAVVDASRNHDAPLHKCFEWNAEQAQTKWNKHVARNVINSVVEVHVIPGESTPRKTLCYVHVEAPAIGPCYMETVRVMSDDDLKEKAIDDALKLLAGVQARYAHLEELSEVFDAVERTSKRIARRKPNQPIRQAVQAV